MSIRLFFTLSIAFVAILTAALFSSFVYLEFREEQYKLIDRELLDVGEAIVKKGRKHEFGYLYLDTDAVDYPLDRYWIRVSRPEGSVIYESRLGKMTDIQYRHDATRYFAESNISTDYLWIDPTDEEDRSEIKNNNVRFRVVTMGGDVSGTELSLVLAKPIPVMVAELSELISEVVFWSLFSVLGVVVISYYLAGRMLKPLQTINQLSREIRESSLDKRIPERKNNDELQVLTKSLNSMFDRLEHSFQYQKEFVSNASHELKSPLTIMRISLEDLLSNPLSNGTRKQIEGQLKITQRMQKLVYDLLDISRLEKQETIQREQVDLVDMVEQVLDDYADIFKARNIAVSAPIGTCAIFADREKLRRMLINLVDNAVKYNHPCNGFIRISSADNKEILEIRISNSSADIPKKDIPLLFDQFFRVEKSRSQEYGGTGLGLTIVKKIVELHGGAVSADSGSGVTTITVLLPLFKFRRGE